MKQRIKYPRTPHLPWSPGFTDDDIRKKGVSFFQGKNVIVTEKMDGENTTMYNDYIHARSVDSRTHSSRNWVKQLHARICYEIPEGWRFCGENVYAEHSIKYNDLESYFILFSIWNDQNECLSWKETLEWAEALSLATPKMLYQGSWNEEIVRNISIDEKTVEGYVVRNADSFHFDDFQQNISKWVRPNHVQSDEHWMYSEIRPNRLRSSL